MNRDTKGPRAMGRSTRDHTRQFRSGPPPADQPRVRIGCFWNVVIVALLLAIIAGLLFAAGVL